MPIDLKSNGRAMVPGYGLVDYWAFSVLIVFFVIAPLEIAWAQSAALTKNYQRGSALYDAGMFEAATPYFARGLVLSEKEYGPNSTRTGFILKNLATVHAKQRKFALAEPFYIRALEIFEKTFGENSSHVAGLLSDLGFSYIEQDKFIQAEPLLARVMKYLELEFGLDDPRVAVAAYNYGYAVEFLGDADKARELYARTLQSWQSQNVPNDARIKVVQRRIHGLTRVLESQGSSLAPYLPKLLPGQATQLDDPAIESALISAGEKQTAAIVPTTNTAADPSTERSARTPPRPGTR